MKHFVYHYCRLLFKTEYQVFTISIATRGASNRLILERAEKCLPRLIADFQ